MSYDPAPLHLLNDIGRAVVAYAQPPLHHRDRRVTSLDHNFYGIIEFRVDFAIGFCGFDLRRQNTLVELCFALVLYKVYHAFDLIFVDKGAVYAHQIARTWWTIQHIAHAQEVFCTRGIDHGAAICSADQAERHTRGEVRFDGSCQDVHRGTLCGEDAVNSCRTRLLRDAGDGNLNVFPSCHHQIRELIDHDDQVGHVTVRGTPVGVLF